MSVNPQTLSQSEKEKLYHDFLRSLEEAVKDGVVGQHIAQLAELKAQLGLTNADIVAFGVSYDVDDQASLLRYMELCET
jgi:hypothetical protein